MKRAKKHSEETNVRSQSVRREKPSPRFDIAHGRLRRGNQAPLVTRSAVAGNLCNVGQIGVK